MSAEHHTEKEKPGHLPHNLLEKNQLFLTFHILQWSFILQTCRQTKNIDLYIFRKIGENTKIKSVLKVIIITVNVTFFEPQKILIVIFAIKVITILNNSE